MDSVFFCLEILGIIAFSISGALVAIKSRFDAFGVLVLGVITAVGGGIIRDVLSGCLPPKIFYNGYLIGISVLFATLTFILAYVKRDKFWLIEVKIEAVNNYFDAVGLAVFTVMGVETAFNYGFSGNVILSIGMGLLTGVGGGVLRDVFTRSPPSIFTKHVYAIASMSGATLYYFLRIWVENTIISTTAGVLLIILLRVLATRYRWKLPKVHINEENVTTNKEKKL